MDDIIKKTLYYRLLAHSCNFKNIEIPKEYKIKIWQPSFKHFKPPGKPLKYISYWFFYYLKIFKNYNYRAFLLYKENILVHSFLVVPAHFKWPYMGKNDVQITYVLTHELHRGKGLAVRCIMKMINELKDQVDSFWYVTDTENKASIRVAEKLGFERVEVKPQ